MRGGMPAPGMDPEEMRRSMEVIRTLSRTPAEISLALSPETVTFSRDSLGAVVLTLGADPEPMVQQGATLMGQAKWTKKGIEISRTLAPGPAIKDKLHLDEEGNLVLERKVELMGRSVEGTLLYRRSPDIRPEGGD